MTLLRLALMGHFPTGDAPAGGIESVTANLVRSLAAQPDLELHVVQHRQGAPAGRFAAAGYTLHNLPIARRRLLPNTVQSELLARDWLRRVRPDAVSSHHPSFTLPALDLGIPTLHTLHGMPINEFWTRRGWFRRAATLAEIWLEWRMLRCAPHIVAISDHAIAAYRRRTRAHFHRIDNPIDPRFFDPGPPPPPDRLLFVGNLTPRKGVDVAIAAIARLRPRFPGLRLEIIGAEADPAYVAGLKKQAAGLGDAIHFQGLRNQNEIKRALEQALALVLPSREEHAPVIVAEAMAAGRAVVATTVGALPDMIEPGVTGCLVPPARADALADALAALLIDPAQAAALGAQAAARARARYHPDAVAANYLQTIHEVMAGQN